MQMVVQRSGSLPNLRVFDPGALVTIILGQHDSEGSQADVLNKLVWGLTLGQDPFGQVDPHDCLEVGLKLLFHLGDFVKVAVPYSGHCGGPRLVIVVNLSYLIFGEEVCHFDSAHFFVVGSASFLEILRFIELVKQCA